jgi:hypothetical protein
MSPRPWPTPPGRRGHLPGTASSTPRWSRELHCPRAPGWLRHLGGHSRGAKAHIETLTKFTISRRDHGAHKMADILSGRTVSLTTCAPREADRSRARASTGAIGSGSRPSASTSARASRGLAALTLEDREVGPFSSPVYSSGHQRRSRGPSAAPAKVQRTIVPPYQSATKGKESSGQCSAYAAALMPPATRPAEAPVLSRFVGAAIRTADVITAKGTTAMMGMESGHTSQRSPTIIWPQWETGTEIRFTPARAIKAANGTPSKNIRERSSPPGRACLSRRCQPRTVTTSPNPMSRLGITRSSLFPDLGSLAYDIKHKPWAN